MLKLLIVDDDYITREGILESMSWTEMGIGPIEQADNGIAALKAAAGFKPDIILTDVRMPLMDGIEMSYKLRELNPSCKIIFMSGYADKEYLKAAIHLRAIHYVEKPINISELKSTLETAVNICISEQRELEQKMEVNTRLQKGLSLVRNELALSLTCRTTHVETLKERLKEAGLDIAFHSFFVTILLRFPHLPTLPLDQYYNLKQDISNKIDHIYIQCGLCGISSFKDDSLIVIHLYDNHARENTLSNIKIQNFCSLLAGAFKDIHKFFMSIGKKINGIQNIHASYETAVLAMQRAFFRGYGSVIYYSEDKSSPFSFNTSLIQEFSTHIKSENKVQLLYFVKNLSSNIRQSENILVTNVKDIFYKLLLELVRSAGEAQIDLFSDNDGINFLWEFILNMNTLNEVEAFLVSKIENYFNILCKRDENNSTVREILNYIHSHYHDQNLSITQISDFTYLSSTYICSLFKEETGKTINQYITEYRMEKAKQLLKDKKLKIFEIASAVGCNDGNYFTKLFRKTIGLTPREYKERYTAQ